MKKGLAFSFLIIIIAITAVTLVLSLVLCGFSIPSRQGGDLETSISPAPTVIIDAGHGGEDGGASSAAGLVEKDVNLQISSLLCDMLEANGINVIMTRADDRLLYDRNTDYHGRKKKLDLAARLAVTSSVENAIFVSIHMNSFTDPRYSGMQVWYSERAEGSLELADIIREKNREYLQPDNKRSIKASNGSIYLLDNATVPSVLVECGFLSNVAEAELFESGEYRRKVAFVIFCAITQYLENGIA